MVVVDRKAKEKYSRARNNTRLLNELTRYKYKTQKTIDDERSFSRFFSSLRRLFVHIPIARLGTFLQRSSSFLSADDLSRTVNLSSPTSSIVILSLCSFQLYLSIEEKKQYVVVVVVCPASLLLSKHNTRGSV